MSREERRGEEKRGEERGARKDRRQHKTAWLQCSSPLTDGALVHVLVAGSSDEAGRAGADGSAIQGVGVTHGPLVTRVAHARIIQVTQET